MKANLAIITALFLTPLAALCAAEKPNVVLFLVDDMGWMDSGAYGSKYYETPNIDSLAIRRGTLRCLGDDRRNPRLRQRQTPDRSRVKSQFLQVK